MTQHTALSSGMITIRCNFASSTELHSTFAQKKVYGNPAKCGVHHKSRQCSSAKQSMENGRNYSMLRWASNGRMADWIEAIQEMGPIVHVSQWTGMATSTCLMAKI